VEPPFVSACQNHTVTVTIFPRDDENSRIAKRASRLLREFARIVDYALASLIKRAICRVLATSTESTFDNIDNTASTRAINNSRVSRFREISYSITVMMVQEEKERERERESRGNSSVNNKTAGISLVGRPQYNYESHFLREREGKRKKREGGERGK